MIRSRYFLTGYQSIKSKGTFGHESFPNRRHIQSYSIFEQNSLSHLIKDLQGSLKDVKHKDEINTREVLNLLRYYKGSSDIEWKKYSLRDPKRSYTRNLVTKITPFSNLLVLVWEPGKKSSIHDHPNSNCFMKILQGEIKENLYSKNTENKPILYRSMTLQENSVAYINDNIGLHSMQNDSDNLSVSLHLYTPSYQTSKSFNSDGLAVNNEMDYYSSHGKIN
ncbi:hypothetical protein WICMUC_005283 [Wickerhamomyces mucosus]|uniref:Cysteine dioxygenase n=1 Tax=Wickerhamomyces mucosus TaxID=1378264 RepID=A0A9P8P9R5_9ASCO|nr:hypothetical protein WICMUC_005283 [Wickerhamomyces mucosus]